MIEANRVFLDVVLVLFVNKYVIMRLTAVLFVALSSRSQEKYRRRSRNPDRGWDREFDRGIKDWEKNKYLGRDRNRDHYSTRSKDHERDRDGRKDNERGKGREHERNRERVGRRQSNGRDHR